jgi:urea transporter
MIFFLDSVLYSYGQIFFSNRRWFGALILIATFITPEIGLTSLLGVVISNFTALVLKYDRAKIRSGFYGFNGILFGAAVLFFYRLNFPLLLLIPLFIIIIFLLASVIYSICAWSLYLHDFSDQLQLYNRKHR